VIPHGIITAAIERLQSGSLTREQRRAAMLLGGGSVQKGPAKRLGLPKPAVEPRAVKVARIRSAVFARAGAACEFCAAAQLANPTRGCFGAEDWHHIIGAGLRRSHESVETTCAICRPCHRGWEAGDLDVLHAAKCWALRHGFREALRAIEKRIGKVEEARASLGKERVTR
jgi:hypothetical protein